MLVLTRKPGESIVIGNEVTVTVIEIRNGQVRLGIEAPRSIEVHRTEVYEQVMAQNMAAVSQAASAADVVKRLRR
jgi:carbon storage regulator